MKFKSRVKKVVIRQKTIVPTDPDEQGFLSIARLKLQNIYTDNTKSPQYTYDAIIRKHMDAVVILLTSLIDGETHICLRECIRPPYMLRAGMTLPFEESDVSGKLWELPAGLLEDDDKGINGINSRAGKETLEETGYKVSPDNFKMLGTPLIVSAGTIPEKLYFVSASVDNVNTRHLADGDGSPVEEGAGLWWVSLDKAYNMIETGEILDMKTEIGIKRQRDLRHE